MAMLSGLFRFICLPIIIILTNLVISDTVATVISIIVAAVYCLPFIFFLLY